MRYILAVYLSSFFGNVLADNSTSNKCQGDQYIEAFPKFQYVTVDTHDFIRPIYYTWNETANFTIVFYGEKNQHSLMTTPIEIKQDHDLVGVKITKNQCNASITFSKHTLSVCQLGKYVCTVVNSEGKRFTETAIVRDHNLYHKMRFRFEVNEDSKKHHQFFSGANSNFTCTFRSRNWKMSSFLKPSIYFFKFDKNGRSAVIQHSDRFKWSAHLPLTPSFGEAYEGSRTLYVKNMKPEDSGIYQCMVFIRSGRCQIMESLNITVRPCKVGHYCNGKKQIQCPVNTWNNQTNSTSIKDCKICPAGNRSTKGSWDISQCNAARNEKKGSRITITWISILVGTMLLLSLLAASVAVYRRKRYRVVTLPYHQSMS